MEESIKNFKCLGVKCPNHCCGKFNGISDKLKEMGKISFSEIILLPEDVENLIKAGKEFYIKGQTEGIYKIKTKSDGTCFALEEGKCLIYNERPSICKAYPLYIDMFVGLCYVNECPAFTLDLKRDEYKNALRSLLDIYQFWIDYYKKVIE